MNKKMMESEYDFVTSLMLLIFSRGKSTIGSSATAASGSASKIHQVIIKTPIDKTMLAFMGREKGFTSKKNKNNINPVSKAHNFFFSENIFFILFIAI